MADRRRRGVALVGAVVVAVALATGCTPEPAPSPTATGFASDAEAFAAAEATYRAYVDALNDVDLADPATFEPVFDWLTGDALADSRQSLSVLHADNYSVVGTTAFAQSTLVAGAVDAGSRDVAVELCLDVSEVDVLDSSGASVVPADRPDHQPLRVLFSEAATSTGLRIASSEQAADLTCG